MPNTFAVNLSRPVTSVHILEDNTVPFSADLPVSDDCKLSGLTEVDPTNNTGHTASAQELENQKTRFAKLCQTLGNITEKLRQFSDEASTKHKEQIAKLSVEIARKLLMQKVQKGDYEIESIVKEALENAPTLRDVVVHLNPEDLASCQKLQADVPNSGLADIKFVADSNIGRAECLLETPKGIVKSSFDEQLERISEALEKV